MRVKRRRNRWKGLLAGALGGLAGSFAMSQFHALIQKIEQPAQQDKEDSTVKAASATSRAIFHHELTPQQKKIAAPVVHYAFGTSMGAIYGALAESARPVNAGWGMPFGAAIWLGAHVLAVPALGLSQPITESTPGAEAAEFGGHLVYGVVVEGLRRLARALCGDC